MLDTRNEVGRLLERFEFRSGTAFVKCVLCAALAWMMMRLAEDTAMTEAARWSLGIVVLAAGLWITEAIPAFAVAVLVIALQIIILGRPGGVLADADDNRAWEAFARPWASPPMWLFFGGLVLARAAQRTELDRWVAGWVLGLTKGQPRRLLPAIMGLTFVFSMFMSNTATCAMMLTVLTPAVAALPKDSPVARALLLGLAFSANMGGMATVIGTPPNAIAAGLLDGGEGVSFARWMVLGLPVGMALFGVIWWLLARALKGEEGAKALNLAPLPRGAAPVAVWQRLMTLLVFVATIGLWMTGGLHGAPTAVVAFLPITVLSMIGVMRAEDMRQLNWDVLLLLAGGLSLGAGIEASGLADWMGAELEEISIAPWLASLILCYVAAAASNLMSNTAAANILLPVGAVMAMGSGGQWQVVVPVALSCSIAMALPIATPPNALVFSSGRLTSRQYLPGGLLALLLGPPLSVGWCRLMALMS
jgi:sodium-dependent dicarboxylate transporter 2/3/5